MYPSYLLLNQSCVCAVYGMATRGCLQSFFIAKTSFVGLHKGQERLFYPYMHLYVLYLRIA